MNLHSSIGLAVLAVLSSTSLAQQAVEVTSSTRTQGSSWRWTPEKWEAISNYESIKGYAERPDADIVNTITVEWKPPALDPLGNLCKIRGQLRIPGPEGKPRAVDWFQGITVYMSKLPDAKLDWSKGMNQETAVSETGVVDRSGAFAVTIDLRDETQQNRKLEQPFQFGVALSEHAKLGATSQKVTWTSTRPALATSVCNLNVPAAPALSRELELINRAGGWPFADPNGVELIRAVNALRLLGKERALVTLEKYVELTNDFDYCFNGQEIVFWIIRFLFEPARLNDRIPSPAIAVFLVDGRSPDAASWPIDPVDVIEDVPLMVGRQIGMGGMPEHPSSHIHWARRHGVIRDEPLEPTKNPLAAAEILFHTPKFIRLEPDVREAAITSIRAQALAMVKDFVEPMPEHQRQAMNDSVWTERLAEVNRLGIHWESKEEKFVATIQPPAQKAKD